MPYGVMFFIVVIAIVVIWLMIEVKRLKHKLFALFLIGMILFFYTTLTFTLRGKDLNYTSIEGLMDAGKIYFSWLGSVVVNMKSITSNAVKMDWSGNETEIK